MKKYDIHIYVHFDRVERRKRVTALLHKSYPPADDHLLLFTCYDFDLRRMGVFFRFLVLLHTKIDRISW